jgi:CO/xanthine dehydrogenase FAD-binding subunit
VVAAAHGTPRGDCKLALTYFGVGDVPQRLDLGAVSHPAELPSQVSAAVREQLDPWDDVHASTEFRRHLAVKLGVRAGTRAVNGA